MKLSEMQSGKRGRIVRVCGDKHLKKRLQTMGILTGEEIIVEKIAPLGDPIDVRVKGYHLSLRKEEADQIEVEVKE